MIRQLCRTNLWFPPPSVLGGSFRSVHDGTAGRRGRGQRVAGPDIGLPPASSNSILFGDSPSIQTSASIPNLHLHDPAYQELDDTLRVADRGGLSSPYKLRDRDWESFSSLEESLHRQIEFKGAMSIHEYMRNALSHPKFGYYTEKENVFGKSGDYITAPDISQMFGEMVGIWTVLTWESMGCPDKFFLVEFGPGKGTLMHDALSVFRKFPKFMEAVSIIFIENSLTLQRKQRQAVNAKITDEGLRNAAEIPPILEGVTDDGIPVAWHTHFSTAPSGSPFIIFSNEFYDAMPIYKFQYTEKGWCEICLDIDTSRSKGLKPVLVQSEAVHSFFPPIGSGAWKSKAIRVVQPPETPKIGDRIEICPMGLNSAQEVGKKICQEGGAVLSIDYGNDYAASDSLRAIKDHKTLNFLNSPGECDVTADVNFAALARAFQSFDDQKYKVNACKLVSQASFLESMGIRARFEALKEQAGGDTEMIEKLESDFKRLTDITDEGMGNSYKVLAVADDRMYFQEGIPIPLPKAAQ